MQLLPDSRITFSVGFANETESAHQQQVRQYIRECHRTGIHVMAYESLANIFWEDMFAVHPAAANWPSIGKDGKPVPYGAANFAKVGRITRYMADLTKPEWRDYLRGRVDLAIDAGSEVPLLQQIYLGLRKAILLKSLAPGSRLPSTRQLADRLGVSRTSVLSAYDRLLAEGYIEGRTGSGTYVSNDVSESVIVPTVASIPQRAGATRRLSEAGVRYRETALKLNPPEDIPFSPGCCSVDAITIEAWRRVGSRQLRTLDRVNLHYADPIGELALRVAVAQYLGAARAVRCADCGSCAVACPNGVDVPRRLQRAQRMFA